jgi:hypothetical protein
VKDASLEKGTVFTGFDDVAVESYADFTLVILDKKQEDTVGFDCIENAEAGGKARKKIKLEPG